MPKVLTAMSENGRSRLESWKEIARHLDVTVRCAQVWEKERNLPVHRHPGSKRSRVFAFVEEIDRWLEQDTVREKPPAPAAPSEADATPEPSPARRIGERRRRRRWLVAVAAVLGTMTLLGLWSRVGADRPAPVNCDVVGRSLRALDAKGDVIWGRPFPEIDPEAYGNGADSFTCSVIDVDGDGTREVLFNLRYRNRWANGSDLACLEHDGTMRWVRRPGEQVGPRDPRILSFSMTEVVPLLDAGSRALLSIAHNSPFYPTEIAFLDPADGGELGPPFFHPGYLRTHAFLDADGDGVDEVVLGGVHNPGAEAGDAVLVALDLPPDLDDDTVVDVLGSRSAKPRSYVIFPDSCLEDALAAGTRVTAIERIDDSRITLSVEVAGFVVAHYWLRFGKDGAVVLEHVSITDEFRRRHREMRLRGEIDHELDPAEEATLAEIQESPYPISDELVLSGLVTDARSLQR